MAKAVGKNSRTVLITGGSGSLGSHIAKLVYNQWDEVQEIRLLDKETPSQSLLTSVMGYSSCREKPRVSFYQGDILDVDSLLSAFVKVDAVIHCAALVENGGVMTRRLMREVNVKGTENVLQACVDCGVSALVFTGSVSQVLTTTQSSKRLSLRLNESSFESTKLEELACPHYGGSKAMAESLVLKADGRSGRKGVRLHTCSLRCPPMFGERDTALVPTAIRAAQMCMGYYVSPWSSAKMQSLYLGNGAWAHVLAAQALLDEQAREIVGGRFYFIGDHSPASSMSDFHAQFLEAMGYKVARVKVPLMLLAVLAYLMEFVVLLLAFLRVDYRNNLNRFTLKFLKIDHSIAWDKASEDFGYSPLYSHETALARSVDHYRLAVQDKGTSSFPHCWLLCKKPTIRRKQSKH